MSKFCIAVCNGGADSVLLQRKITAVANKQRCVSVRYELSYEEPFLERNRCPSDLIVSFTDKGPFDNCEMLLLPDNCYFNGDGNMIPHCDRMEEIRCILQTISEEVGRVDLFIGDSGVLLEEFEHHTIKMSSFPCIISKINSTTMPDLHLSIAAR